VATAAATTTAALAAELVLSLIVRLFVSVFSSKSVSEMSKRAGEMWRAMNNQERAVYEKSAKNASQSHTPEWCTTDA